MRWLLSNLQASATAAMPDWNLEKKRFLSSILFYTRIPVSGFLTTVSLQKEEPIESSRYFPLTGILVGAACSLVFLAAHYFLPKDISILIGLAVGVWITGALHEDGLADSADGFGAGWNPEQIRKIMKDSSIGVYGMLSLLFVMFIKFETLHSISIEQIPLVWIAGHAVSRLAAIGLLIPLDYLGGSGNKSSSMVQLNHQDWLVAGISGILPVLFLGFHGFLAIIAILILNLGLSHYFKKRIGGVTGDCLGASQQLSEILFYLMLVVQFNT